MTTAATILAFQTINAAVSGITAAPSTMPAEITDDMLPCALTLPGAAVWHPGASLGKGRKCQRTYHVRVYAAREDNPDVGDVFGTLSSLLDAVGAAYRAVGAVSGHPIMGRADEGSLRTYGYAGRQFFGFEHRVTVEETRD